MSRRFLAAAGCAVLLPTVGAAQQGTACDFVGQEGRPALVLTLPSGERNVFTGGGVRVRCPARGITLRADSLELFGEERRIYLLGNVNYDEPRLRLTSDVLTYYVADERVVATGRVNATLPSGSRLVGPYAEYRRAVPRIRTLSEMTATGRPSVFLVEGRSSTRPGPTARQDTTPTVVTANTIFVRGDSLIYGSGQVDIRRPDLTANGDSLFLDSGREFMRLLRSPRIEGRRDRPYRLAGRMIDVYSTNRQLDRVVAQGSASAVSEDMTLTADTIDLRVAAELLQRAVAWGPGRARAVSPTQTITADSITAEMPNQRVRTVTASRGALAEARPDTARIDAAESDWLRGDTIVASFDTISPRAPDAAADTTRQPQIRQLVATGDARSLYHLPPSDTTTRQPAINYVTGALITVAFDWQRVKSVTVAGQRLGVYLEPTDSAAARGRPPGPPDGVGAADTDPPSGRPRPSRAPGSPTRRADPPPAPGARRQR